MIIRPYLTFQGNCEEAMNLYVKAFKLEILEIIRFADLPPVSTHTIPEGYMNKILQARMKIGDGFIRLSDCSPGGKLKDPESERISLAIEASVDEVKHAFATLAETGRIGMPLAETFYSPCAGVVFDKFGVMWNLVATA